MQLFPNNAMTISSSSYLPYMNDRIRLESDALFIIIIHLLRMRISLSRKKQIKALLLKNAHSFIMRIVIFSIREKMWIEKLW